LARSRDSAPRRSPARWKACRGTGSTATASTRRLERLRAQYEGLIAEEDHGRLEGWADRVESLSQILQQIEEKLALGTSSL
jgi:hypothetical protein